MLGERGFSGDKAGMNMDPSDLIVGVMMAIFGLIGLVGASGAMDNGIFVFGMSLFVFSVLFIFGLIKRAFDRAEEARHE